MFRSVLWFLLLVIYVLLLVPAVAVYFLLYVFCGKEKAEQFCLDVSRFACLRALKVGGIKIEISGLKNLPEDNFFIAAPNHVGSFDAIAMLLALDRPFCFAAKKTLSYIPIVGIWFKIFGAVFVPRSKPETAAVIVEKCSQALKNGRPLLIFPEGTRSKTGKINDIKTGVFRISEKTSADIVPVVIKGSRTAWEENVKITPCVIKVKIMPPVESVADTRRETLNKRKKELREIYENN